MIFRSYTPILDEKIKNYLNRLNQKFIEKMIIKKKNTKSTIDFDLNLDLDLVNKEINKEINQESINSLIIPKEDLITKEDIIIFKNKYNFYVYLTISFLMGFQFRSIIKYF